MFYISKQNRTKWYTIHVKSYDQQINNGSCEQMFSNELMNLLEIEIHRCYFQLSEFSSVMT